MEQVKAAVQRLNAGEQKRRESGSKQRLPLNNRVALSSSGERESEVGSPGKAKIVDFGYWSLESGRAV